jgi:hypothetical protein
MAVAKKTTASGPRKKPVPKAATKKAIPDDSVVALITSVGMPLIIRANPTDEAVRSFVEEHTRRYIAGEAGGPSGIPPYRIYEAARYNNEQSFLDGEEHIDLIDIADLLPQATP